MARGQANGLGGHAGREGAVIGREGAATSIFATAKARIIDAHSTHTTCAAVEVATLLAGACLILSRYPAWARWRSRRPSTRLAILPRVTPIAGTSTTVVELCGGGRQLATKRFVVQLSAVCGAARKPASSQSHTAVRAPEHFCFCAEYTTQRDRFPGKDFSVLTTIPRLL